MSSGHSHGRHESSGEASRQLQLLLAALLVPLALLSGVGMLLLYPAHVPHRLHGAGAQARLYDARVVRPPTACRSPAGGGSCGQAGLMLLQGPDRGREVNVDVSPQALAGARRVVVAADEAVPLSDRYAFTDLDRRHPLSLLAVLFTIAVVALGRWTGLRALVGLAVSGAVVLLFVVPALLGGANPSLVALAGSGSAVFLILYTTHGFNVRTGIAVLGTLASLFLTVLLSVVFVRATKLTGLGSDEASLLVAGIPGLDVQGLFLAGITIGTLGVLDDITVTQASAVWELHQARPHSSLRELYASGVRIGRDHIASTVNTLVLVYAGSSLPLLAVFTLSSADLVHSLTGEVVAQEVLRTLVGSIGLVVAVPVTTALAAFAVRAVAAPTGGASEAPVEREGAEVAADEPGTGAEPEAGRSGWRQK